MTDRNPPEAARGSVRKIIDNEVRAPLPPPAEGDGIIKGLPIVALGKGAGVSHYLEAQRQYRAVSDKDHTRLVLLGMVGAHTKALYDAAPRRNANGDVTGWRPELIAEMMQRAAAERGLFDPMEKIRGRGAWRGAAGELLLHCGDWILRVKRDGDQQPLLPGLHGGFCYPATPAGPRPGLQFAQKTAGRKVLDLFGSWNFRRPAVDRHLLLGEIGAAILGGALDWRPAMWLTGGHGCGKTTLQRFVRELLHNGIVSISDASAAGLWQKLAHSSEPIGYDEIEARRDGDAQQKVVELIRKSASGGIILRGSADHTSVEFTARSCFLCSSILIPPMGPQDRSRITVLELAELKTHDLPAESPQDLNALGSQLRQRIVDGWPRFADTLGVYRSALIARGHNARDADQLANLLAPADLLLSDGTPTHDELAAGEGNEMAKLLDALTPATTREDAAADADQAYCLNHLLSTQLDTFRNGAKVTVGRWVAAALEDHGKKMESVSDAVVALAQHGLRIAFDDGNAFFAVANCHAGLNKIFYGSNWAGRSDSPGVWVQALRRLPGAKIGPRLRFAGALARCTLIPMTALGLEDEGKSAAAPPTSPQGELIDA